MDFSPRVYSFMLPKDLADSVMCWDLNSFKVERPSFAVLLDHTLGVIWHIFNLDGAELSCMNKADFVWALRFLEAIDTSTAGSTEDFDALVDYLRKILIARYSREDEFEFLDSTMSHLDSIGSNFPDSSSLEEFLASSQVQEDMKNEKPIEPTKCTDEDLLKRLKDLNPMIMSLDDVKNMINP